MSVRAKWTSEDMRCALRSVKTGKLSERAASRIYKIPRRTLHNHVLTGSKIRKLGANSTIPLKDEKELVSRIIRMADIGIPLTAKIIRIQAYRFVESNGLSHKFRNGIAGK